MDKKVLLLRKLNQKIIKCKKCPRLESYIRQVADTKVKRFSNEKYWGKPLTGFGDINAELLLIGLAPAAHGGNRTGRMFTGDSSGDWVAKVLYENGFATKPTSQRLGDGFCLINAYITASIRCAPPQNKPLRDEMDNCFPYLQTELSLLKNVKVIVCLGRIAFNSCCKLLQIKGMKFSHGKSFRCGRWIIISTYHPSRQNTQTGCLTWKQWFDVFSNVKKIIDDKIKFSSHTNIQ
ncbi:MAG: uracil-DNA glycosylase [Thaumarchaeota archaeon]|nr:uracil-DNA glycosylase [Nitrososphaerota archaeon]MBI3642291.1 uracil-DNA glycosylase [Nitrososphaerota archaeon]